MLHLSYNICHLNLNTWWTIYHVRTNSYEELKWQGWIGAKGLGEPTHTFVLCWMPKPLPPRNRCTGWFTPAGDKVGGGYIWWMARGNYCHNFKSSPQVSHDHFDCSKPQVARAWIYAFKKVLWWLLTLDTTWLRTTLHTSQEPWPWNCESPKEKC